MNRFDEIKRTKPGRKGDPRMNRAVGIRLANPAVSLFDALVAGGFVFSRSIERQTKKDGIVYDSDGVSLNRRRNQLSKRLWQATRKDLEGYYESESHNDSFHIERNSEPVSAKDKNQNCEFNLGNRKLVSPAEKIIPSSRKNEKFAGCNGSVPLNDWLHIERNSKRVSAEDRNYNRESNLGNRKLVSPIEKIIPSSWQNVANCQSMAWKDKVQDELHMGKETDDASMALMNLLNFLSDLPNDALTDQSTLENIVNEHSKGRYV